MYAVHTTPGFVIDSRPYGEAGKILSIFTRDLGLVAVTASGIRFEKSKLRYYVQNYSFATFSLVRGKEFWRLTSAAETNEASQDTASASAVNDLTAKIAVILKRLLQGEEAHPELFELVQACIDFARTSPGLSEDQFRSLESLTVLRILHALGYVGNEAAVTAYLASSSLDTSMLDEITKVRQLVNRLINHAIQESHL